MAYLSDQDACYAAAAWASGAKQRELARQFGHLGSGGGPMICLSIGRFLDRYSGQRVTFIELPDGGWRQTTASDRKRLVRRAVENYLRLRDVGRILVDGPGVE